MIFLHLFFFESSVKPIKPDYTKGLQSVTARGEGGCKHCCLLHKEAYINLTLPGFCKPLQWINDITILQACRERKAGYFTCAASYHWQHEACIPTAADSLGKS